MYLLIDNYDSFTYNLWHFLGELGAEVAVHRNDKITVAEAVALKPAGIILSPGPCDPDQAGICLDLINQAAGKIPIFGVCLGHQAIGQSFQGRVVRASAPMHGKVSEISHTGHSMFKDVPRRFNATRYHSLIVERATLPGQLEITATTDDGLIMAVAHKTEPIFGVQFHPESIATQHGHRLLANFMTLAGLKPDLSPMLSATA